MMIFFTFQASEFFLSSYLSLNLKIIKPIHAVDKIGGGLRNQVIPRDDPGPTMYYFTATHLQRSETENCLHHFFGCRNGHIEFIGGCRSEHKQFSHWLLYSYSYDFQS
jgi:hypothetical protein